MSERVRMSSDAVARMLQGGQRIAPGVWVDREGALHFSIPELLEFFQVEDTPANREELMRVARESLERQLPNAQIVETEESTH